MFSFVTNFYIFLLVLFLLAAEYLFSNILYISYFIPWLITLGLYAAIIFYQFMSKASTETEKAKIKTLIDELYYTISGIPIVNKNDKLIIKWDIIFKKLVDHKEFKLYDKILRTKTSIIDQYVNQFPSLLLDNTDLKETKYNIDLNSVVKGKGKKPIEKEKELVNYEEYARILFIKEITTDRAAISNYDDSIHMDVLLSNEYYPEGYEALGIEPDMNYDGFSVDLLYGNNRYNIVPRLIVAGKTIDKEKWFYRNINRILQSAHNILNGDEHFMIPISEKNIIEFLNDSWIAAQAKTLSFEYVTLDDKYLIFNTKRGSAENIKAYCEFDTAHNSFEVKLIKYEKFIDEKTEIKELERIIAIGHSYQPIITLLQKMPDIIKNLNLIMNNQDIIDIVIR